MTQPAWETAMGMRGYAGSPAEQEDRATMRDAIRWARAHGSAMVCRYPGHGNRGRRHLRVYIDHADRNRPYVRIGKRGTIRKYLDEMGIRIVSRECCLAEFTE